MLTFLRFFSFFHMYSIIFAANPLGQNILQYDPHMVIYNRIIGDHKQNNSIDDVMVNLCDVISSVCTQNDQKFQKIFLLSSVEPNIDFKVYKECSFSTQSLNKRKQSRSQVIPLINAEKQEIAKRTTLQDPIQEKNKKQKEEDLLKK